MGDFTTTRRVQEILGLTDEPKECNLGHHGCHLTHPKRTLAGELDEAWKETTGSRVGYLEAWEAVASKAKEFILNSQEHAYPIALIIDHSEKPSVEKAEQILDYLRGKA